MESPNERPTPSFARHILLAGGLLIGLLLLAVVLWYAAQALLLTFAAILFAIVLRSLSDWLADHTRLSEGWALAAVLLILAIVVIGLGLLTAPQVVEQAGELRERLPDAINRVRAMLEQQPWGQWLIGAIIGEDEFSWANLLQQATGYAVTAVQLFVSVFILLFVTLYLAIDPRLYTNGVLHLIPVPYRMRAAEVLAATGSMVRWWLFGTLIRMLGVGLMTFVGLWALDVPLAMILAILAGLLDFVPYFGPIVAGVPAVLLAFMDGPTQGLYVIILYVVVQQIESLILSPVVYHRTVYLPPVLTILAQVLLFAMAGVLGAVLATPLIAVVLVWVKMLYVEQTLGDHDIDRPEAQIEPDNMPPLPGDRGN